MKVLIMIAVIAMVAVAGFVVAYSQVDSVDVESSSSDGDVSCSSCGNSCTAGSNCGRATCGAVSGTGSCGCNR